MTGFWQLASGHWLLEGLGCQDARKLESLKVCDLRGTHAFELTSLIAFQPPSKTLTFEPQNPELVKL